MKPIRVGTTVERPVAEVYEYLDVLANHEAFTDHMLVDWTASGPATGVGASVRVRPKAPGPPQWADITVVEAQPPSRIVEQSVSTNGKRRTTGTYTLAPVGEGRTQVRFELAFDQVPAGDRLLAPVVRPWLARANRRAMERLATKLA